MIGMIALGGIIVRVSILLVEFVKIEVMNGKDIRHAAVEAAKTRLRPILITSLTTMVGAGAILTDPIFNGMAVSILFGMSAATVFTMIVIPLGCISAEKRFHRHTMEGVEAPMGSKTDESVEST